MLPNRSKGRSELPSINSRIAHLLEQKHVKENSGLFVVFEQRHIEWPSFSPAKPFYVSRTALENDGPEPETPPEILGYFSQPDWNHFIWLPNDVSHGDVAAFTMQYAHELRHYCQRLNPSLVQSTKKFLDSKKRKGWMPFLKFENDAAEFDAHENALRCFEDIHGFQALQDFVSQASQNEMMKHFYERLFALSHERQRVTKGAA